MFENVFVGVDGEEGGRDAIALADALRGEGGKLTLAHVYPGDPHVWRGSSPTYEAVEEEQAHTLLEKARSEAGIEAELVLSGSSSVGRGLHELAEAHDADLIVIGTCRRGLLGRVLIGDDTRAAMNGAPCAVAIAPGGYSRRPVVMHEIGVGYDGSPESEHALRIARTLAAAKATRLSAMEVVYLAARTYPGAVWPAGDTIEAMVAAARGRLGRLEGVTPHAVYGAPVDELTLYSASLDLLVLGARDYGPLGRLAYGSTAHSLARLARCPLLVLTRAARAAEAEGDLTDRAPTLADVGA